MSTSIGRRFALSAFTVAFLLLNACGNDSTHRRINTVGLLSGQELSLEVRNRHNSGNYDTNGLRFKITKETLFDESFFSSQIPGVESSYYDGNATIKVPLESGQFDFFSLTYMGNDQYLLVNSAGSLVNQDDAYILLPHHLIRDERIKHNITPDILSGMPYELYNDDDIADRFYHFYDGSGWYQVSRKGDDIYLEGYAEQPRNTVALSNLNRVEFPLIIRFTEVSGQRCFSIDSGKD